MLVLQILRAAAYMLLRAYAIAIRYLGSLITEDGYYEKEIRSRIGMAKKIFQDKKKLFIGKMNLELKKRIMLGVECSTLCCRNVDFNPSG